MCKMNSDYVLTLLHMNFDFFQKEKWLTRAWAPKRLTGMQLELGLSFMLQKGFTRQRTMTTPSDKKHASYG